LYYRLWRIAVGTRSVRLDAEAEETLDEIQQATGLSVSAVLKRGLLTFRRELASRSSPTPFEIYQKLDLGPGGYAEVPSSESRRGVREALQRKLKR
jgi:hypothetical protein